MSAGKNGTTCIQTQSMGDHEECNGRLDAFRVEWIPDRTP